MPSLQASAAPSVVSPAADPVHPFDEAIRLEPLGEGRFGGATHPEYWNQVGPFGVDQQGQVWSQERELLATTHQIVWFKE